MIPVLRLPPPESEAYRSLVVRRPVDQDIRQRVDTILEQVREHGDEAVLELTQRFDGVRLSGTRVPDAEVRSAVSAIEPPLRDALQEAISRVKAVHSAQRFDEGAVEVAGGVRVWREWRPYDRVGLYVPGGRSGYPSSALMLAVPARLAGCAEVVLCSPPSRDGRIPTSVLAAAALAGVTEVHAVGGAQAIAALAYGTAAIRRVDKIFGPGNAYVTAAKLLVFGEVGVDMPAGPSELVVVADRSASSIWVAADLRAQAEHAPDALGLLVTTDQALATSVARELGGSLQVGVFVAADLAAAVRFANDFAPEHLELVCESAGDWLSRVSRVGSVFLGSSPAAAGDYATGANHVLPTGGAARSFSALGLDAFGRCIQVQAIDPEGIASLVGVVDPIAAAEGFTAHRDSVRARRP